MDPRALLVDVDLIGDKRQLYPLAPSPLLSESLEVWSERYIEDRVRENIKDSTVASYREAFNTFMEFSAAFNNIKMEQLGDKFIDAYIFWYQIKLAEVAYERAKIDVKTLKLIKANLEPGRKKKTAFYFDRRFSNTLSHRLVVVKQVLKFISYHNEEKHDYLPSFAKVVTIPEQTSEQSYLSIEELHGFIALMQEWPDACKSYQKRCNELVSYRDSLLMLIYAFTGARAEEVAVVRMSDIGLREYTYRGVYGSFYTISLRHTKNGNIRELAVFSDLIKMHIEKLKEHLSEDDYIGSTFSEGASTGKHVDHKHIYLFFKKACDILGYENKAGLHDVRRGYATEQLSEGVDIGQLAIDLGHTSWKTTQLYAKNSKETAMRSRMARKYNGK